MKSDRETYSPLILELLRRFQPTLMTGFDLHLDRIEKELGIRTYYETLCNKHVQPVKNIPKIMRATPNVANINQNAHKTFILSSRICKKCFLVYTFLDR